MSDDEIEMAEYLPVKVRDFPLRGAGEDATFDDVVMGDVCDTDNGCIEIGFTVKGVRRYVKFRQADLCTVLAKLADSAPEQQVKP